jgi:hypothetical protein
VVKPPDGTKASIVVEGIMSTKVLVASLVALAVTVRTVGAQRPEQQEVGIPGSGIMLKAGWQLLFHDGCRFAVPGSWRPNADGGFVSAPDGSNLSVRMFRITSWPAHKAQIRAAFGQVNVLHEDSDRRLWFEIGDKQRTQHYIDVANGLHTCTVLLEIRAVPTKESEDTTNRIADSIGPAPDK